MTTRRNRPPAEDRVQASHDNGGTPSTLRVCQTRREGHEGEHYHISSALTPSQVSHYDSMTNRCYVQLTVRSADMTMPRDCCFFYL
jgi:hypothetical protein